MPLPRRLENTDLLGFHQDAPAGGEFKPEGWFWWREGGKEGAGGVVRQKVGDDPLSTGGPEFT